MFSLIRKWLNGGERVHRPNRRQRATTGRRLCPVERLEDRMMLSVTNVFLELYGVDGQPADNQPSLIEIDSFSFGVGNTSTTGQAGAAGRATILDFRRVPDQDQPNAYLAYELKNALITSYQIGGSSGVPTDSFSSFIATRDPTYLDPVRFKSVDWDISFAETIVVTRVGTGSANDFGAYYFNVQIGGFTTSGSSGVPTDSFAVNFTFVGQWDDVPLYDEFGEMPGPVGGVLFCVQYRESDFNFASRLIEEEGIYYFFSTAGGGVDMPAGDLNSDGLADITSRTERTDIAYNANGQMTKYDDSTSDLENGAVADSSGAGATGDTQAHEVGQWLGVYHTFQVGCSHHDAGQTGNPTQLLPLNVGGSSDVVPAGENHLSLVVSGGMDELDENPFARLGCRDYFGFTASEEIHAEMNSGTSTGSTETPGSSTGLGSLDSAGNPSVFTPPTVFAYYLLPYIEQDNFERIPRFAFASPNAQTFRLTFPTQTATGTYTLTIGPAVQAPQPLLEDATNGDAIWIDIGFPIQQLPDGRRFTPLFAFYVEDLDNRVNVNVAQLAVNIVDYIDQDEFSTPFNFLGLANGLVASPSSEQPPQYWVFGTELPSVVLNEALAQSSAANHSRLIVFPDYDWYWHLDRQLVSPIEHLPVSGFAPGDLSQLFVNQPARGRVIIIDFDGDGRDDIGYSCVQYRETDFNFVSRLVTPCPIDNFQIVNEPPARSDGVAVDPFNPNYELTLIIDWAGGGQPVASPLASYLGFEKTFLGGVYVAAGDVNGDGLAEIITGRGNGKPEVRVFDGASGSQLSSFLAYAPQFVGGVRVAAGDVDGDGRAEIITSPGAGNGGGHVKVFHGTTGQLISSFLAYGANFQGGIFVAAGDLNGDGRDDIITGAGPGAPPHVKVFDATTLQAIDSFFAYDPSFRGGVRVAAGDVNGDGRDDIITAAGSGATQKVRLFDGESLAAIDSFFALDPKAGTDLFIASRR